MGKHPILHYINEIKNKLGFSRTMTASGADVVDAVNKHSDQIVTLDGYLQVKMLTCSSLDNLKSELLRIANSLPYNRAAFITFWNSGVTDVLTYNGNYGGTLYINYKSDTELIFDAVISGKDGSVVSIGYYNGTWTFENLTNQIAGMNYTRTDYGASDITIIQGGSSIFGCSISVCYNSKVLTAIGYVVLQNIPNSTTIQITFPNPTGRTFNPVHGAAQIGRRMTVNSNQVILFGDPAYADPTTTVIKIMERNTLSQKYASDYGAILINFTVKLN